MDNGLQGTTYFNGDQLLMSRFPSEQKKEDSKTHVLLLTDENNPFLIR